MEKYKNRCMKCNEEWTSSKRQVCPACWSIKVQTTNLKQEELKLECEVTEEEKECLQNW